VVNKKVICVFTLILFLCSLAVFLVYRERQALQAIVESAPIKVIYANIHGPLLGYYLDFSEQKYTYAKYTFDEKGIPLFIISAGSYYHPVLISQFALGAYEHYLKTNDTIAKEKFLACADWLKENLKQRENFYYWEYKFKDLHPGHIVEVPWVSAMAQGTGVSVLVRAFSTTGEITYLETAKKAIIPIFHDLSVGGVSVVKGENYIFPQEYPTDPPSNVLNGAISAYLGVHDYYRVTNDLAVKIIEDKILKTFRDILEQYDTGYWSLYCQWPGYLASAHYQLLHVQLLRILYSIGGDEEFRQFAEKFEHESQIPMNQVKYVFANHLKQIGSLTPGNIKKIPDRLAKILKGEVD